MTASTAGDGQRRRSSSDGAETAPSLFTVAALRVNPPASWIQAQQRIAEQAEQAEQADERRGRQADSVENLSIYFERFARALRQVPVSREVDDAIDCVMTEQALLGAPELPPGVLRAFAKRYRDLGFEL